MGVRRYVSNAMNLFDAVIVVISMVEIPGILPTFECLISTPMSECGALEACTGEGGSLMVLRTFRLVRVVKLLRAFPDVQKQIKIVISVLGSVAALNGLILLFLLIFCILGMNVFGGSMLDDFDSSALGLGAIVYVQVPGDPSAPTRYATIVGTDFENRSSHPWRVRIKYGEESEVRAELNLDSEGALWTAEMGMAPAGIPEIVSIVPRLNYDSLLNAAITTFQVLTVSNWPDDLYTAVGVNGSASGLYFYTLITIGNWMLLNLFIAILIQGFAEQKAIQLQKNLLKMQEEILKKLGGLDGMSLYMYVCMHVCIYVLCMQEIRWLGQYVCLCVCM
jgi:hypothetical protein